MLLIGWVIQCVVDWLVVQCAVDWLGDSVCC